MVFCTPSMKMEAWVVAAVWPENSLVQRNDWECRRNPGAQLGNLPKTKRFEKRPDEYERRREMIGEAWPTVAARLTEASRFEKEFLAAIPP